MRLVYFAGWLLNFKKPRLHWNPDGYILTGVSYKTTDMIAPKNSNCSIVTLAEQSLYISGTGGRSTNGTRFDRASSVSRRELSMPWAKGPSLAL